MYPELDLVTKGWIEKSFGGWIIIAAGIKVLLWGNLIFLDLLYNFEF